MDVLQSKKYEQYDYTCRYTGVPYYYNKQDQREIYGLGSNMAKNTPYITHAIKPRDTLDSLSLKYYGNPTYWWVIAYFNDLQDAFIKLQSRYTTIKIPNISSIEFGAER